MNAVVQVQTRLPLPTALAAEMDVRKWRVLCEATFPNAKSAEAIVMAVDYCRARGLDVFKKPVHIVPMWNSALGKEVETVWPGINEIQVTASRTGQWAGMDEPKWGSDKTATFKGRRKVYDEDARKQKWESAEETVTFPEWCAVTVYRMIGGAPRAFTEPVYWIEAYSTSGGKLSKLPTDMWIKRPHGQLHKVAKAASLRAAFPEEGEYTAEEMEGKEIEAGGIVIDHEPAAPVQTKPVPPKPPAPNGNGPAASNGHDETPPHDPETGEIKPHLIPVPHAKGNNDPAAEWAEQLARAVEAAPSVAEIEAWLEVNAKRLANLQQHREAVYDTLKPRIDGARAKFAAPKPTAATQKPASEFSTIPGGLSHHETPEARRKRIAGLFAAAKSDDELTAIWDKEIDSIWANIMPPDKEDLGNLLGEHQRRIEREAGTGG